MLVGPQTASGKVVSSSALSGLARQRHLAAVERDPLALGIAVPGDACRYDAGAQRAIGIVVGVVRVTVNATSANRAQFRGRAARDASPCGRDIAPAQLLASPGVVDLVADIQACFERGYTDGLPV